MIRLYHRYSRLLLSKSKRQGCAREISESGATRLVKPSGLWKGGPMVFMNVGTFHERAGLYAL